MGKILIVNTGPVQAGSGRELSPDALAKAVTERLSEYKVGAVYVCPLPGAEEMAQAIAGRFGLQTQLLPGLGEVQDVHWKETAQKIGAKPSCTPAEAQAGDVMPHDAGIEELLQAAAVALDDIAVRHKKETAVIVSQRVLSVIMILHLLHLDSGHYSQIEQDPGAVNLFETRFGLPSALYINDTCHLHGLK